MSGRPELKLDWCTHEAAKYAVEHWHYSRRMPKSKLAKVGVWEGNRFVGAVIFGVGATPQIAKPFSLQSTQVCELVRVALGKHFWHTSRIVAIAVRMVSRANPGLRVIVSFADTTQGHHGGIYQACNWLFVGSAEYHAYSIKGEIVHPRTCYDRYGIGGQSIPWIHQHVDVNATRVRNGLKHKYVMPLDAAMRAQLEPLRKPYPKRAGSADSGTPGDQPGGGGATPTSALSVSRQPERE